MLLGKITFPSSVVVPRPCHLHTLMRPTPSSALTWSAPLCHLGSINVLNHWLLQSSGQGPYGEAKESEPWFTFRFSASPPAPFLHPKSQPASPAHGQPKQKASGGHSRSFGSGVLDSLQSGLITRKENVLTTREQS